MDGKEYVNKGFWQRPEGVTGAIFMVLLLGGGVYGFSRLLPQLILWAENTLYLGGMLMALAAVVYVILDPKARNLMWYGYKSFMRAITRLFVNIDPIGVLKGYIEHLEGSLGKMTKQMNQLRGQMHKLKELMVNNQKEIQANLMQASKAKDAQKEAQMILKTRKAGRLTDSNMRLDDLYKRMETLYRILKKMHETSFIMAEDLKDQILVKETERNAIMASHSAMQSAMSILTGNPDKRAMFDMALEAVANDVSAKMGEMENFMNMSDKIMKGIDLQNGVFEEEGLKMLEEWEKKGSSLLLGTAKDELVLKDETFDLNQPVKTPERSQNAGNQYDAFFD
ncbi:MAG: hypothetical protein HC817_11870 [Saprospiraceae bacterium]|nr:hypothetical protein [Saprospiraceae bacterium]